MRGRIDEDRCCGFAACLDAPEVFDLDHDQIAVALIPGELPVELETGARAAAQACPTDAIVVEE